MARSLTSSAAHQLSMFPEQEGDPGRVVNVAQVAQLSPFATPVEKLGLSRSWSDGL
jgi:hypothetical protein